VAQETVWKHPWILGFLLLGLAGIAFGPLGLGHRPPEPAPPAAVPPPIPEAPAPPPDRTPLSAGTATGDPDEGIDKRSSPQPHAPTVPVSAAADHVLRFLVLGDEQQAQPCRPGDAPWPERAAATLQDRLRAAAGPWAGARVELLDRAPPRVLPTADAAFRFAMDGGWEKLAPEMVIVAVGWQDGAPRESAAALAKAAVPLVDGRGTWLEELAALSVLRDIPGTSGPDARGFYLRSPPGGSPALAPLRHLELLDSLGAWAADHGAALIYLEQPVRHTLGERRVFASTAMRPQPWINLVWGLEQEADVSSLFCGDAEPLRLSALGAQRVGDFVGMGLVQAVIGD
jgi:hypothetical protein